VRAAEGEYHDDRGERDDEREYGTDQDRRRGGALASGGNVANARRFLYRHVDRVTNEAFVLPPVDGLIVFHVAHDRF